MAMINKFGVYAQKTALPPLVADILAIAGGGHGGNSPAASSRGAGGGGAGGRVYQQANLLSILNVISIAIGDGGANYGDNGDNTTVSSNDISITAIGGGSGSGSNNAGIPAGSGGSGGGGGSDGTGTVIAGAAGTPGQGYDGADSTIELETYGGGGGGAGSQGGVVNYYDGGAGDTIDITGTPVEYAKGGKACTSGNGLTVEANKGHGGEGAGATGVGSPGGSGVVIIRYPAAYDVSVSAGLTYTTDTVGTYKVTKFTAGTGTVEFTAA